MLYAEDDRCFGDTETLDNISYYGAIILIPRFSCMLRFKLYPMDVKSAYLNKYLNVKVEEFPFSNKMKRILENLTKPYDKDTQEKEHVVINMSDNINDVFANIDEGTISVKEIKDFTFDSHSIYVRNSCTQL